MNEPSAPAGLYLHVPFCAAKCPYCDFYSVGSSELKARWLANVPVEAALYHGAFPSFDTLYLGGGTPSGLSCEDLAGLISTLGAGHALVEVTVEANPEDVSHRWIEGALAAGATRVSLGVQSFDARELEFLGRRHTARDAVRAIETVRRAGCANLSVDLIHGLPGQTEASWLETLERALDFEPEHLSCYGLTVEHGTRLAVLARKGALALPDEETSRALFMATSRFLTGRGYVHYEISNFARSPHLLSRHNTKYWHRAPYLGLGPSAHSFLGGRRWWNLRSVRGYCESLETGRRPVAEEEVLTPEQCRLEAVLTGIRTSDGVSLDTILVRPSVQETVDRLVNEGLATVAADRLVLTREGMVVSDRLALMLSGSSGDSGL